MQTNDSLCKSSSSLPNQYKINYLVLLLLLYHDLRSHPDQNDYFYPLKAVSHLTVLNKSTEKRTVCSSAGFCFQDKYFASHASLSRCELAFHKCFARYLADGFTCDRPVWLFSAEEVQTQGMLPLECPSHQGAPVRFKVNQWPVSSHLLPPPETSMSKCNSRLLGL